MEIVFVSAIVILRYSIVVIYKRRKKLTGKDNFIIGMNNLTFMLFGFFLFVGILHVLGITIREFFTSITIIAAALAIVFRDYILNGLNGMIIMFGDNFQIGDFIEVDGMKGHIEDLTLLNVHLKNDEDNLVIIPNNLMAAAKAINYSKNPRHFSSIDFEIRTRDSLSFETIESEMKDVLDSFKSQVREGSQSLTVMDFENDIVHYRYRFGLNHYNHPIATEIKQSMYRHLLSKLEKK